MKKNSLLMIAVAIILSSCGITSQYTSSSNEARFQDGIYSSSPSFRSKAEKTESRTQADALIEETKASQIYLIGEKKDTVMIPQNMSASIRYDQSLASTVITVGENPYTWQNNIDPWYYYTPYSIGSSWYWSRHYNPWYGSSWYWNRWTYSPYYYGGWYDPYYCGGWYDPWYYGGWYDPWYYGGWYGYTYPYWNHHYHHHHHFHGAPIHHKDVWRGSRYQSSSDKVFTSRVSTRGGTSSSRISRTETRTSTGRATVNSTVSGSRSGATRVTATPVRTSTVRQEGAAKRTVSNYRRPGATSTGTSSGTTVERNSSTTRSYRTGSTSSSSSSSSYNSSSSYRSSSSPSYRSSSSSSPSRSSSFSTGGGSSRSGGGSHGRR